MSAIAARGSVLRPTPSLERTQPTNPPAARATAAVSAFARRLNGLFVRGIEPTRAAYSLTDPEQIRRLASPDAVVDNVRWRLIAERYGGLTR